MRPIGSWRFSRKWQIEGTEEEKILKNGDYKKMANFGKNGEYCQTFIKGMAKYSNKMTKRGILTNGNFTKISNLARIYRFGKN